MKTLISGHRQHKLEKYSIGWITDAIESVVLLCPHLVGLSGMADGIDLIYCEILLKHGMGYQCYLPFEGQEDYMSAEDKVRRQGLIDKAWVTCKAKNSKMVEDCESGIIVWDGNKGGTHNVFQQMLENKKPFFWIEPHNQKIIQF